MRDPDNVVTAKVLRVSISVVDLEATGGTMWGSLLSSVFAVFCHACGMLHDNDPGMLSCM